MEDDQQRLERLGRENQLHGLAAEVLAAAARLWREEHFAEIRIVADEHANLRILWFPPESARGGYFLPSAEPQGTCPSVDANEDRPYSLLLPNNPGGYPEVHPIDRTSG